MKMRAVARTFLPLLSALLVGALVARRMPAPLRAAAEDTLAVRRDATVRAVERVAPTVVNISTERVVVVRERLFGGSDLLEDFFGDVAPRRRVRQTSLGSGVIIDADGFVVTNAHVVARATTIQVTLPRPTAQAWNAAPEASYRATLVNISPENDLALLRIAATGGFPKARIGRSDDVMIGETVIALGNPFGLESSVTRGVISATGRSLEEGAQPRFRDFLQTDAAINPGNSGGPLVNIAGDVIGINTAIHSQAHGIGFAIPIARVLSVLSDLLDEGELAAVYTGLKLSAELAPGSAVVVAVAKGSPAEKAGLAANDTIDGVEGKSQPSAFDVRRRIIEKEVGQKLRLHARRGTEGFDVELEMAAPPALPGEQLARQRLGLRVKPLTPLAAERTGVDPGKGVRVVFADEDGPGGRAGVQTGDLLVRVGLPVEARGIVRWGLLEVHSLDDLAQFLAQVKPGTKLLVQVIRDGREYSGEMVAR